MSDKNKVSLFKGDSVEKINAGENIEAGQWYWVKTNRDDYMYVPTLNAPKDGFNTLAMVTHIGSNYVQLRTPDYGNGYNRWRVHFNEVADAILFEPNWREVVRINIDAQEKGVKSIVNKMQKLCASLGVDSETQAPSNSTALMVLSSTKDLKSYQHSLTEAKEVLLPRLKKRMDTRTKRLTYWMSAEKTALEVVKFDLNSKTEQIDDRIDNVSLYAGLEEHIEHIKVGEVADESTTIHIMQRLHYMDEECLVDYDAGGMGFENIGKFDEWMARDNNFKRLLPFDKAICAFRVRRNKKDRGEAYNLIQSYILMSLHESDQWTYLYVRNGDNLYRLGTSTEFPEEIFPDTSLYGSRDLMMSDRGKEFMTVNEYEERLEEQRIEKKLDKAHERAWRKKHPEGCIPEREGKKYLRFSARDWVPFNSDSVYYDDALKKMKNDLKSFNKTALVIQGLLDRSRTLQPHPRINLGDSSSFLNHIKLIYDSSRVLNYGEAPDFEDYQKTLNNAADKGDVFIGQQKYWENAEREKDAEKNGYKYDWNYSGRLPCGNNGPGKYAKAENIMPRAKKVTFKWLRESTNWQNHNLIGCSKTIPMSALLCMKGYKKGDYKQFYTDPRTRLDYLQWAPLLLGAEDWLAMSEQEKANALNEY